MNSGRVNPGRVKNINWSRPQTGCRMQAGQPRHRGAIGIQNIEEVKQIRISVFCEEQGFEGSVQ
jgi:hypothetical protein